MPIPIALLALAAIQAAPPAPAPASPPTPAALSPDVADERCLAAFAWLASEPGRPAAAAQADRYGQLFFYGKLMGRDPGIDLGAGLRGAVTDLGGRMQPEIARCSREVEAAGHAMAAAGESARPTVPAR